MNVISIDFSKKCTAIFSKIGTSEKIFEIKNKPKDSQEIVLKNIFDEMLFHLNNIRYLNYDFGIIEGYTFNKKKKKGRETISEICGVIKLAFAIYDIPLISIKQQTWKAQTIGAKYNKYNGNYLNDVYKKYGKKLDSIDAADAYLIYLAVKKIYNTKINITPAMQKIKDRLKEILEEKQWKKNNGRNELSGNI